MEEAFGADWKIYGFWLAVALILLDPQGMSKIVKLCLVIGLVAIGLGVYNDKWDVWDYIVGIFA